MSRGFFFGLIYDMTSCITMYTKITIIPVLVDWIKAPVFHSSSRSIESIICHMSFSAKEQGNVSFYM